MNIVNAPLVSVIIPTYGRADMLNKAINSVLTQTYQNIEVVVVNDNQYDSEHYQLTMQVLKYYMDHPKVKIVADGQNAGGSLARNKGIKASLGEYISFLDDDDYYYKNKISKQINHLISKEIDVSVCGMDVERKGIIIDKGNINEPRIGNLNDFLLKGNCYTPMVFLKRDVLTCVGNFTDTPRFQDHILMLKILNKNFKVDILNENLFVHNDHQSLKISTNKINSYDVRWSIEADMLYSLDQREMNKYNFNKMSAKAAIYRDNCMTWDACKILMRNLFNINSMADVFKWVRSILALLFKI